MMTVSEEMKGYITFGARVAQWVFSLIAFSVLASDEDDHGFHYTDWTSLAWVVLVGAIIWLFTSFMLLTIAGQMQGKEFLAAGTLTKIETIGDAVLAFFCYTATIDLSVWSSNFNDQDKHGDPERKIAAACAFMWLTTIAYVPLLFFKFQAVSGGADPLAGVSYSAVGTNNNAGDMGGMGGMGGMDSGAVAYPTVPAEEDSFANYGQPTADI